MNAKAKALSKIEKKEYNAKDGSKEWQGKMKAAEGSMKCSNCGSMKHMSKMCPEK